MRRKGFFRGKKGKGQVEEERDFTRQKKEERSSIKMETIGGGGEGSILLGEESFKEERKTIGILSTNQTFPF
jgi:hypothetical protein